METVTWTDEANDYGRVTCTGQPLDGYVRIRIQCEGDGELQIVTHLLNAETARKIAASLIAGADWLEGK